MTHRMTRNALADLLTSWLPAQRWFAAAAGGVGTVAIISDIRLAAGDPELRHLMVDVTSDGEVTRYQIWLGLRRILPDHLDQARIGPLGDGRTGYDAAHDPELTTLVLRGIAEQRSAGPLRFLAEPATAIDPAARGRMLPPLQSNTSIVFGETAILKLLRRPYSGHHPDLEVPAALARNGSRLVAAPLGWIELADGPGEPTILAILSQYFPGARNGWTLAIESLDAGPAGFTEQSRLLGRATARMHAELAAAFGTSEMARPDLHAMAAAMTADLKRAIAVVPELARYERVVAGSYAELVRLDVPIVLQRIHGDYHLGQVLATNRGWVVLDFEGEPSVPLARRRAFAPALRDVAGMLRSFDYAGRYQALERKTGGEFADATLNWVRNCQDAFRAGYADGAGAQHPVPEVLLRALTLSKAVYEAEYEARHRATWLPIPLAAIAEALS